MGRNAGWITAASALARSGDGDGPDLICLPERPFDEDRFLSDIENLRKIKDGILAVVSEGLKKADGTPDRPDHLSGRPGRVLRGCQRSPGQSGDPEAGHQGAERKAGDLRPCQHRFPVPYGPGGSDSGGKGSRAGGSLREANVMIGFERIPGPEYGIRLIHIPVKQKETLAATASDPRSPRPGSSRMKRMTSLFLIIQPGR